MSLICVFDGLRPDMVRPDWTPNLWSIRQRGVWCRRSHCVFPSVTRVNSAALTSGSFPGTHGLEGNSVWRPSIEPSRRLNTGEVEDLRRIREHHGRMLRVPTLPEVLGAAGHRTVSIGTGSSGGTFLMQPEPGAGGGITYHHSFCDPPETSEKVAAMLDAAPASGDYTTLAMARVEYAARALADVLVPEAAPALAAFWITLPDGVHHRHGLGSPEAIAAIQGVDAAFGSLAERLGGSDLNVIVTADHGYATVSGHVDVADELVRAGLKRSPESTDIVTCADGGACLIYAEPSVDLERVAAFLLAQEWAGALFSRDGVPGTLPLAAVNCAGPNAPSMLLGMAWQDVPNEHGIVGRSWGQGGIAIGAGDHGGISPFEMRNTLLLAGPAFRQGIETDQSCGIVDIAPTVLHSLGIVAPAEWDGRVLAETLRDGGPPPPATEDETIVAKFPGGRQVLTLARAGGVSYPSQAKLVRGD